MEEKTFYVKQYEVVENVYEVKAKNAHEAVDKVLVHGEGDMVKNGSEPIKCAEYGMPLEKAQELGLDVEYFRSKNNIERNHEYVESLASVEEE